MLVNPSSLPSMLPHDLVKLYAAQFLRSVPQFVYRLEHWYLVDHIDVIRDEHKLLLHAFWTEPVLKHGIDAPYSRSYFKDG